MIRESKRLKIKLIDRNIYQVDQKQMIKQSMKLIK